MTCLNGGTCIVDDIEGEKCDCRKQNGVDIFVGDVCETPAVCKGSPCQNGGHCDFADDLQECFILPFFFRQKNFAFSSSAPKNSLDE